MKPTTAAIQAHEALAAAQEQAARLYPHSPYLQGEWLRALGVVRSSSGGYLLDKQITRENINAHD